MSQDLLQLVQRSADAVERRDVEAIVEGAHPDIEWIPRRAPIEGAYRGRDAIRRFWEDTFTTFDEFAFELDEIRPLDDKRVLLVGQMRTRGHGSGVETLVPAAGVAEYRDGLLYRWQDFLERDRALEALALDE